MARDACIDYRNSEYPLLYHQQSAFAASLTMVGKVSERVLLREGAFALSMHYYRANC